MSTFNGEIQEIRGISVDNFENKDLQCYFLSHCHSDHMRGLENLSQISAPLYTTNLSALIVSHRYPSLNIHVLEYGIPTNIEFFDADGKEIKFIVTALNGTGHCLGACMLLFQIEGLDILYTGDFRISLKHAQNITLLNEIKSYKNLVLYVDTTFLSESYKYFPSQSESCLKIVEIIKNHLKASHNHKICLQTSARYGYERLFIEINKKLNEQVYIFETNVYEQYSIISELSSCITSDKNKAKIFLKPSYIFNSEKIEDRNTLTIQLSAMFWKNLTAKCAFDRAFESKNSIRVCYSTHNSCSELEEFVKFLEPKIINPTVIPNNIKDKEIMMSVIKKMLQVFKECNSTSKEQKKKFRFKRLHELNFNGTFKKLKRE